MKIISDSGKIDPTKICPWETGRQFLSLPESEVLKRITLNHHKVSEKEAKDFYLSLWKIFIDARTRERKAKLNPSNKRRVGSINHPTKPSISAGNE